MDWKHFDAYDIDQFNKEINKFKYNIDYELRDGKYLVKFVAYGENKY